MMMMVVGDDEYATAAWYQSELVALKTHGARKSFGWSLCAVSCRSEFIDSNRVMFAV